MRLAASMHSSITVQKAPVLVLPGAVPVEVDDSASPLLEPLSLPDEVLLDDVVVEPSPVDPPVVPSAIGAGSRAHATNTTHPSSDRSLTAATSFPPADPRT